MAIFTYREYLEKPKALTVDEMQKLHEQLLAEIKDDDKAVAMYEGFIVTAVKYADIRASWKLIPKEQRSSINDQRTACHNQLIVHFDEIAKQLRAAGKPAQWREELGYEEVDKYNRKRIGDFACYISFIHGINAR